MRASTMSMRLAQQSDGPCIERQVAVILKLASFCLGIVVNRVPARQMLLLRDGTCISLHACLFSCSKS